MNDFRIPRPESTADSVEAIIQPLAAALAKASAMGESREILSHMTRGQKLLLAYFAYWDDVTNGGHAQYFANYTSDLWPEALEAMEALRLAEGSILREAVALFPGARPASGFAERQEQLEKIDADKLDELDTRFNEGPGSAEQLQRFVEEHANEFFLPKKA